MKSPRPTRELLNDTIRGALGDSIVISRLHVDEDIWSVECEPDMVRKMITELSAKAGVAMKEGVALEVEAVNQSIGLNEIPTLEAGKYVRLSIIDRGAPTAGRYPSKTPDPYFPAREQRTDQTIGVGLFEAYSIAKRCDGYTCKGPQAEHGRVFQIYFPASTKRPERYPDEPAGSFAGKARVLLMDDDDIIRDMAAQMLDFIGYEVELVKAGAEAIERYKDSRLKGNPFDVVILDLTIPEGMGGKETVKALIEMDPAVKVILSSGETGDPVISHFSIYGFSALLPKPYGMQDLIEVLQEVHIDG
jgi:CheY-like chemotaxis protein